MFSSLLFSLERSLSFFTPTLLKSRIIKALLRVEIKTERERKKKEVFEEG